MCRLTGGGPLLQRLARSRLAVSSCVRCQVATLSSRPSTRPTHLLKNVEVWFLVNIIEVLLLLACGCRFVGAY